MWTDYSLKVCTAAVALLMTTGAGNSYAGGYIGVDGSSISVSSTVEDDTNPRGIRARLGVRVSRVFDIEVHLGSGSDEATDAFDELGTAFAGLYLKGYLPVGQRSALFAMAGGAGVELTQTLGTSEFSDNRTGISYGFGLETELTRHLDLSADYVRYTLDDDQFPQISAVSLGLKWYF